MKFNIFIAFYIEYLNLILHIIWNKIQIIFLNDISWNKFLIEFWTEFFFDEVNYLIFYISALHVAVLNGNVYVLSHLLKNPNIDMNAIYITYHKIS